MTNKENRREVSVEEELRLWRGVFGMLHDPEDYAEFEAHAQRRPLFSERTLELEPDDEGGTSRDSGRD